MTVKLFCAVVGLGSVFPVDIDMTETVGDLNEKIKEKKPGRIYYDADLLKLYLARESGTWLTSRDEAMRAVKAGQYPDRITNLMQEHLLLNDAARLDNDAYFGKNFQLRELDIHVLVECPDEPEQVRKYKRQLQWCGSFRFAGNAGVLLLASLEVSFL